jgi:hypothetical protein
MHSGRVWASATLQMEVGFCRTPGNTRLVHVVTEITKRHWAQGVSVCWSHRCVDWITRRLWCTTLLERIVQWFHCTTNPFERTREGFVDVGVHQCGDRLLHVARHLFEFALQIVIELETPVNSC